MAERIRFAMLIDDDEIDNFAHQRLIKKSGLIDETITFEYGQDALDFLIETDRQVDVIFLDVNMPKMNGFKFSLSTRALPSNGKPERS